MQARDLAVLGDPVAPDPQPAWQAPRAAQQPEWHAHPDIPHIHAALRGAPPLVDPVELDELRGALAAVADGRAVLLHAGDCAEPLDECAPGPVDRKLGVLDELGAALAATTDRPAVRVGRLGGQFAKPRSQSTEERDGVELPVFRGHLVNDQAWSVRARRHDPHRLLRGYAASRLVLRELARHRRGARRWRHGPWSSHEALVLDYEAPACRTDPRTGERFLASTHLPWVGERTRQPESAQVRLLHGVRNPVASKIGPEASVDEVLELCEALDPARSPGRLTLIVRMGHRIHERLPPIVEAVAANGHRVVWLSDPMHGNTVRAADGRKTRYVDDLLAEAVAFRRILVASGEHPGGLHLEVAADDVTECVGGSVADESSLDARYTTLCDPRLNPAQARTVIGGWR